MQPLVSVVIPIYNVEQYLSECLDSVLNQTYKNIEIILINDGSPDNCDNICKKYAEKNANIKYFYQENQGVSVARNFGLSQATGDYIYFLDSDDSINDFFIESSIKLALKDNTDIVITSLNISNRRDKLNTIPIVTSTCEIFIKKDFWNLYPDIIFPEGFQHYEDCIFSHELLCMTDKVSINQDAVYNYRMLSTSSSHTASENVNNIYGILIHCFELLNVFYDKYTPSKMKISYMITRCLIIPYWNNNFSKTQKQTLFNNVKYMKDKYNLQCFSSDISYLSDYMVKKFVKCRTWKEFEKYNSIIQIYKKLKGWI